MFRIIKVIKTIRTLRLLKFLKGLNMILESLSRSLPVVGYLAILYFILLFSFGVLGVVLVGNVCSTYDRSLPGARATRCLLVEDSLLLEEFSSFRNMEMALLTLVRLTTGDGWADVLNKASVTVDGYTRKVGSLQQAEEALRKWNTTAPQKLRLRASLLESARGAVRIKMLFVHSITGDGSVTDTGKKTAARMRDGRRTRLPARAQARRLQRR